MASSRYDYLKKEIPPMEPPKNYTKQEKRKNFWHYYKWHFAVGAVALILVFSFVYSIVTAVKPDYVIGLISQTTYPEALISALEANFTSLGLDVNNDGKTVVVINQYTVNLSGEESGIDPNMQMANQTRLMGDLQLFESIIFLTPDVEKLQEAQGFFAYNDGTSPAEGAAVDYSKMGVKWAECKTLTSLPLGDINLNLFGETPTLVSAQSLLENISVVLRTYESPQENTKKSIYYKDCIDMFNKMTAK